MPMYYNNKYNVNIKMSSRYNKLCNKQNHGLIFLVGHICIKDKDHQMS
jgi:hypothetical protein